MDKEQRMQRLAEKDERDRTAARATAAMIAMAPKGSGAVIPQEAVRLYSVAEVADRLSVSVDYIYDRINDGTLRRVELGTGRAKSRIRADDLQAFIDERTHGAR